MRPVLALLTDFGLHDHYVGVMKAVVLGIARDAALIDLTHDIAPQDVLGGALELAAAVDYLPEGTVAIAVVDPGVGTRRRAVAAEGDRWQFVGPDNGVLSLALARCARVRVVSIENPAYVRPAVGRTFEGRDRFAPAAAWLATGVSLDALGPAADDWVRVRVPAVTRDRDMIVGEVVRVDRFGNLITNLDAAVLAPGGRVIVEGIDVPAVEAYGAAAPGGLCALAGSSGHVEIAVSGGSAAVRLGVGRGAVVRVPARDVR